jgi:hypothetical protein
MKVVDVLMFHEFREYLISYIFYINMHDNVFNYGDIINYIFTIDYIYNFIQIKLLLNENKTNKEKLYPKNENDKENELKNQCENIMKIDNHSNKSLYLEGEYKEILKSEETSLSFIKLGMNFKKRQ